MTNADKQEEKHFAFKVNGIEIATTQQRILAHDILELAKKAGAMPAILKSTSCKETRASTGRMPGLISQKITYSSRSPARLHR